DGALVATVDADFELLRPRFVRHMLQAFRDQPRLIGFSTDYSPRRVHFESFTDETIMLNERNHTWFCVYRREAFALAGTSPACRPDPPPPCGSSARACSRGWRTIAISGCAKRRSDGKNAPLPGPGRHRSGPRVC